MADQQQGWGPGDALIVSVNEPRFGGNDLDSAGTLRASVPMTKFYSATTSENPTEDPNWFYYYKDNAGGGAYTYTRYGPSMSLAGRGDHSIKIADEAYAGDKYIITHIDNGQLKAVTLSGMNYYYANFTGVLAHERQHAKNEVPDDHPDDNDNDHLTNAFEVSTSHTDPNVSDSARGSLPADIDCDDGEIYAGGVVEEEAIKNADTSEDWAHPGTNWH